METLINKAKPHLMHIDLNSCFATIEQQANPLLRGKPVAIAAYSSPRAFILAPSIEAKQIGIKMGMRIQDAQMICSNLVVRTPDPGKYRDVHTKFIKIFHDYSPDVTPKSIDEALIDFTPVLNLRPNLLSIGAEIKQRIKDEIGEWIRCSVGIGTNMFLAKLAASLHKPDGLTEIDHTNLLEIYSKAELLDFCGINVRYQARLNMNGIYTPLQFFNAPVEQLERQVFRSIVGRRWYEKMRGFEADQKSFATKTIGQQYALKIATNDEKEISRLLMKLCEKMGRRLRRHDFVAHGIHIGCRYLDRTYWHRGRMTTDNLYTTFDLYKKAKTILAQQDAFKPISLLSVTSYDLTTTDSIQLGLFEKDKEKERKAADALDEINNKYGEYTVVPGIMMKMDSIIHDSIAFGGMRDIENLYNTSEVQ